MKAGEVVIELKADSSQVDKELDQVKKDAERVIGELNGKNIVLKADKDPANDATKSYEELDEKLDDLFDDYIRFRSELLQTNNNLNDDQILNYTKSLEAAGSEIQRLSGLLGEDSQQTINYAEEIAVLDARLKDLVADYDTLSNKRFTSEEDIEKQEILKQKIQETRAELEQLNGQDLHIKGIDDANESINRVHRSSNKVLKSLRRWTLAIFGIQSSYMLVRTVMNGVIGQNKQLGDQLDGIKKSFGAAFTPVITKIINLVKTLMAYINYVWQRLFGKDLFSDKVAKDLNSGAKSAKEIRNQLAGFDEANVLSANDTSSGGAGGGGSTDLGLSKIPIPKWLEKLMDWVEKHPKLSKIIFGLAAFTLFGGWKLASGLLGTISSILGGGAGVGATGLIGILGTLSLIAGTVWVVYITYNKVKEAVGIYKDLKKQQQLVKDQTKDQGEWTRETNKAWLEHAETLEKGSEERQKYIDGVIKNIEIDKRYAEQNKHNKEQQSQYKQTVRETAEKFEELRRGTGLTEEEQYKYYKMLRDNLTPEEYNMYEALQKVRDMLTGTKSGFDQLDKEFRTQYLIEVKQKGLDALKTAIDNIGTTFKNIFNTSGLSDLFNKLGIGQKFNDIKNKFKNVFHADGGIINFPGRGVPINIGGEEGREGIIPMDNQQQMALLGQEIAKYVNINNVVNNYMDARKINTLLRQSESKERLANNG